MNISSIIGLVAAFAVFITAAVTSTPHYMIFLNGHAFLIVVGGTFSAAVLSFPMGQIVKIFKVFVSKILGKQFITPQSAIAEIVALAEGVRRDEQYLSKTVESIKIPFLKEAVHMFVDGGLTEEEMDQILLKRADVHFHRYEDEAGIFRTIARFPPAFGLLGAVLGMIALMQGLGAPDSFKMIGPSMALAMVATLYGIGIANFFFVPIGENLTKLNKQDQMVRQLIVEGVSLLRKRKHPLVVEEYLKSYLLPSERMNFTKRRAA
jgi:chemotaxis protein MotA